MPHTSRIPTPFRQHLHRFRVGALPALAFVFCVALTLWLWNRQSLNGSIVGVVEAQLVDVSAETAGRLVGVPEERFWQPFDRVRKGQPIAYLDDKLVQAKMATAAAEIMRLQAEFDATHDSLQMDEQGAVRQHQSDLARVQWETERRRLDRLKQYASIKSLLARSHALKAKLDSLERHRSELSGIVLQAEVDVVRQELGLVEADSLVARRVYTEMDQQYQQAKEQLEGHPELHLASVETALKPIQAAVIVQERLMDEIQAELDNLVITAPIDGVISSVYRRPQQTVTAGEPIVSIARPDSDYVVSYVREQQHFALYEGMEVGLRLRGQPGAPEYPSTVEGVGPQVTPIPPHQLSDQSIPEWATPIRIPIPPELRTQDLRPGQLVQVIFRTTNR